MPVKVTGTEQFALAKIERKIERALKAGWRELGRDLIKWLKENSPKYKGTFQKSHRQRTEGQGIGTKLVIFSVDPISKWKDQGRPPSKKQPPVDAMFAWVVHKGLLIPGSKRPVLAQQATIAFLIGRSIALHGTYHNPKWPAPQIYDKVEPENRGLIARAKRGLEQKIADILNA